MTKFELPEKPKKTNTSEDFNNLRKAVDELDKFDYTWKTYANKADRRINAANKHIEELERENQSLKADYNNQAESILLMLDEIKSLKSQLQQQALPVVPECVAKTVELLKKNPESSWSKLYSSLGEEGVTWLNDFQHKDERFGFGGLNSKLIVLFHLAINGYTVEKPQQKRYEVKLLSGESMHFNPIGNSKNIKDYRFSFGNYAGWKTQFTKSELAEIKDGMFLKRIPGGTPLDDLGKDKSYYVWLDDCNYWINPLIELVPVEDGE